LDSVGFKSSEASFDGELRSIEKASAGVPELMNKSETAAVVMAAQKRRRGDCFVSPPSKNWLQFMVDFEMCLFTDRRGWSTGKVSAAIAVIVPRAATNDKARRGRIIRSEHQR
jgi:hypothetical protein